MNVTIVVPAGSAHLSSTAGSYEIFNRANDYWKKKGNRSRININVAGFVELAAPQSGPFEINAADIEKIPAPDLIIIPSLAYNYEVVLRENKNLVHWIREQYEVGAEIASICTGAFLLAATGLLDGKRCSTHWNAAQDFRRIFPNIDLQTDKLLTAEKGIYTNGGAYSFLNMILFLIEKYFDRDTAIFCSKVFEIEIDLTSQAPFFIFQAQKNHGDELICDAQTYIEENLDKKISFERLAATLSTSRRNFDRRFIKATGNTPVEYLQRVKIEMAKNQLETSRKSIFDIMNDVGYTDNKAFREVFKKITGLSPLDYKARFSKSLLA